MPREISPRAVAFVKVMRQQFDRLIELENKTPTEMGLSLPLQQQILVFNMDPEYFGTDEKTIQETGVWSIYRGVPVFINSNPENEFGSPDSFIHGHEYIIKIDKNNHPTISKYGLKETDGEVDINKLKWEE